MNWYSVDKNGSAKKVQEKRAALEAAPNAAALAESDAYLRGYNVGHEAALTPGEPDDKRQERALSHAYCLYSNLAKTDDAAMQAFRSVWADAFTHGFQSGKTAAPPAQTLAVTDEMVHAALREMNPSLYKTESTVRKMLEAALGVQKS